jgi:hypothetical protein
MAGYCNDHSEGLHRAGAKGPRPLAHVVAKRSVPATHCLVLL